MVKKYVKGAGSWTAGDGWQYVDAIKSTRGSTSDGRMSGERRGLLSHHRERAGKGVAELSVKKIIFPPLF